MPDDLSALPLGFSLRFPYGEFYAVRGAVYDTIAAHSRYLIPVDAAPGRVCGRSRVWGDATPEAQRTVIDTLVARCIEAHLTARECAQVLAIARHESGFNPDAAAGTTSAAGLGQFVRDTGKHYGLDDATCFDVHASVQALIAHFRDNQGLAGKRGYRGLEAERMIYKFHHDGPTRDYGGYELSVQKVMPWVERFFVALIAAGYPEKTAPPPAPADTPGPKPAALPQAPAKQGTFLTVLAAFFRRQLQRFRP